MALAVVLSCAAPAWAQKVTTIEDLTLQQVFVQLTNPLSGRPTGEAIALATALEISTQPFGTTAGGFVFKLDPSTGLLARTTTTFGPSFGDSAITAGEGKVNAGATFSTTTYDKLTDMDLHNLPVGSVVSSSPTVTRTGTADFNLSSQTIAMAGAVGVSPNVDIGVVVPLVVIRFTGTSALVNGNGVVTRLAETTGKFSGIGDMAATAKWRFVKFKGPEMVDPGGIALMVTMRLPTGDRDNLRGLGLYRTYVGGIVSFGKGRIKPHGSGGFEYWNKGIGVPVTATTSVEARHQIKYAAGVEIEAAPKITVLVDFIGQHIRDAGQVGIMTEPTTPGISSAQSMVALSDGIRKALLVPGIKVNLIGKLLLSVNALITLHNDGLHSTVTPVVGLNLTK